MKSIGSKITVIVLASIIIISGVLGGISIFSQYSQSKERIENIERILREDYDELIKSQVSSVTTQLDSIQQRIDSGEMEEAYGKEVAADIIRSSRYSEEGYFG